MKINDLIQQFIGEYNMFQIDDKFETCCINIEFAAGKIVDPKLKELAKSFANYINMQIDNDFFSSYFSSNREDKDNNEFIEELIETSKTEPLNLRITINKNTDSIITIYDLNTFIDSFSNMNLLDLLWLFSEKYKGKFLWFDENSEVKSSSEPDKNNLQQRSELCHFFNSEKVNILPELFQLNGNMQLSSFIGTYLGIISLTFIADVSNLKDSVLYYKINGYKTLEGNLNLKVSNEIGSALYEIYRWVYNGSGSISDRLGIARNIITLQVNEIDEIDRTILNSIKSNYQVYLKENVSRYIEIQEQINKYIFDFTKSADEFVNSFTDKFSKSLMIFVSYYISILVLNIIQKNTLEISFTKGIQIVSFSLIGISLIYCIIANLELYSQKKRFNKNYLLFKERYEHIIHKDDLNNILNDDEQHSGDNGHISFKQTIINLAWIALATVFSVMTCLLGPTK